MASLVLALLLLLLLLWLTFSDIEKRFEQSTSSIIGDKFELVDEVFDDTDDKGDIGDSDETDDEHPSRDDDDDGDIFSLQIRAVNTSSSSISESELGGFDTGGTGNLPAARKLCSNSSN